MADQDGSQTEPWPQDAAAASGAQVPSTIGRYQVRRVVGSGGMGVVLAAHEKDGLEMQVALSLAIVKAECQLTTGKPADAAAARDVLTARLARSRARHAAEVTRWLAAP